MVQLSCPSCGTPVAFRSEFTLYAGCPSCGSLCVRKDVDLEVIGKVGELQPDGSLLQIGTQGIYDGKAFEVYGRIQVALGNPKKPDGYWNEWFIVFGDGRQGWIGEAMGAYFVNFQRPVQGLPGYNQLTLGNVLKIADQDFVVSSKTTVTVSGFEGELPFVSKQDYPLPFADLRSPDKWGVTLDYSDGSSPTVFVGEWCAFQDLKFHGLRTEHDPVAVGGANVTSLKCPNCGAPHELRGGAASKSLVCQYCDTAVDLNADQTFAKVVKLEQKNKVPAALPIGSKGKLGDEPVEWECIGFLRKSVVVDGIMYFWSEYLLYNRENGYRWLTENNGHWTLLKSIDSVPTDAAGRPIGYPPTSVPIQYKGHSFKHFQNAHAHTEYAAGEFYWRVRLNDRSNVDDFVAPPYILSADTSATEILWSAGYYYEASKLWRDFKLPGSPPPQTGVANNQVNTYSKGRDRIWTQYLGFVVLTFFALCGVSIKSNRPIFDQTFTYLKYEAERSQVAPIELKGRTSNVKFALHANYVNRWCVYQLTLINDETHVAYDTGCQISYYQDGDGSYGSQSESAMIPSVPPGNYTLRIEPTETGTGDNPEPQPTTPPSALQGNDPVFAYTVKLYRDVAIWGFFWPYAFFLLMPPLWVTYKASRFETQRWAESDHAPVTSSESE